MSELAARLRRLQAQTGAAPASPTQGDNGATTRSGVPAGESARGGPGVGPVPASLLRLLGIRTRGVVVKPRSQDRMLPGVELGEGLRLVECFYDWPDNHSALDARFAGLGWLPRDRLLYFDTETTGLSGGSGTRAFMIGAADWTTRGLRVRQLMLSAMSGEAAMLSTFATWLAPDTTLVSYNGRSYDAPLLATRYRLARQANPLSTLAHLDLLYPTRRRFRGHWENCRLGTIEREWLGIVREDDLPGSEAPRAWRDYLRGGSANDLRRVAAHNDQDLRSLAHLLSRLSETEPLCLRPARSALA